LTALPDAIRLYRFEASQRLLCEGFVLGLAFLHRADIDRIAGYTHAAGGDVLCGPRCARARRSTFVVSIDNTTSSLVVRLRATETLD
jgi:hypothetical protein